MTAMEYSIEDRIAIVRENIERAAQGRPVVLVGVAKTKPAELVRRLGEHPVETAGAMFLAGV